MSTLIPFALENFTLTCFIIGLLASGLSLLPKKKPLTKAVVVEALFSYFLLFSVGISFFYNFIMHSFFGETAARFIGWQQSPFQFEVGTASLGYAVVGFLAFRGRLGMRAAAVIGPAMFLWGAAGGHIYQMITQHNFAPGNAGIIFYTDLFLPVIGFVLLAMNSRSPVESQKTS